MEGIFSLEAKALSCNETRWAARVVNEREVLRVFLLPSFRLAAASPLPASLITLVHLVLVLTWLHYSHPKRF